MSVETDPHGRIYLSAELRDKYGERFHIVEYQDRIELIPVDEDPLQGVQDAAGDAFAGVPIDDLREEAREAGQRETREDLDRGEGGE